MYNKISLFFRRFYAKDKRFRNQFFSLLFVKQIIYSTNQLYITIIIVSAKYIIPSLHNTIEFHKKKPSVSVKKNQKSTPKFNIHPVNPDVAGETFVQKPFRKLSFSADI